MTQRYKLTLCMLIAALSVQAQQGWRLIWSDEFNTDGRPDTAVWSPENGFVRQSGSYGLTDDFPEYYHRTIEFNYSREL